MGNIVYSHDIPPSIESKFIQCFMGLIGMKRMIAKKIMSNGFRKEPAAISKSIQRNHLVHEDMLSGRKIWTISPMNKKPDTVILYLHGGAYYANISRQHWRFIEQLLINTQALMIVPDYPLAPELTCCDVYEYLEAVYSKLVADHSSHRIVMMGDSAGGGLALGLAQAIRNNNIKQPEHIILFSPWLDVSMSNPDIANVEKFDKILSVNALKTAGKKYAGNREVTDCKVSPIYGELSVRGRISVFTGTNEVLFADARKLKKLMDERKIDFSYYEYPEMFHDWVIFPNLKEAKDVIQKICIGCFEK